MKKIYLYEGFPGKPDSKLFTLLQGGSDQTGGLFQKLNTAPFRGMVTFVADVKEAEAVFLPHTYFHVAPQKEYVMAASHLAKENNIPLLLFTTSDFHDLVKVPNSILLRTAAYRSLLSPSEVIIPAFVEDLGEQFGYTPREKTNVVPSVGFSGMVQLSSTSLEVKYHIRKFLHFLGVIVGLRTGAQYQGLYYRRKLVTVLQATEKCTANFYIRKFFSAAESTIQGDPDQIRNEFVSSITDSDLALVVRGNGNFSLRFFEVLSLGRIPLFIDTDTPLPLEDEIDYDSFMLRVDYKDINKLPEILETFWRETSPEQFVEMQRKARQVFETKLKPDVFFKAFFSR